MSITTLPSASGRRARDTRGARTRRLIGAALLTVGLAGLAACGGGGGDDGNDGESDAEPAFVDGTAEEIAAAAVKDTTAVSSLTMTGAISTGQEELTLDLALDTGGQCQGSIGVGGGTAQIVSLTDAAYLKGDDKFWAAAAGGEAAAKAMLAMVGDKWIKVPSEQNQFGDFCDLDSLLENFEDIQEDAADVEKGEVSDINGVEAIALTDTSDANEETTGWIATASPHYLVRVESSGDDAGTIDLSNFDEPVDVTEPAAGQVVDLGALGGAGGGAG